MRRRALRAQASALLLLVAPCLFGLPAAVSSPPAGGGVPLAVAQEARPPAWLWAPVEAAGSRPTKRQGHASVEVGNQVYVIGGCDEEAQCFSDVHVLDADTFQWRREAQGGEGGPVVPPRGGHSAVLMSGGVVVFGGANTEETFGDTHVLNLDTGRWEGVVVRDPAPGPRTNHAACAGRRGRMFVFGGYDEGGLFLNELWSLRLFRGSDGSGAVGPLHASWELVVPVGQAPAARQGHTLTAVDRQLVLFGGYVAGVGTSSDVHVFDPETRTWAAVQAASGPPPPRQAHSAAHHGSALVIAGGCDTSAGRPVCFNDVWTFSLEDSRWTIRSAGFSGWPAREGHTSAFVRGRMFLFGGCQLAGDCFDDLVALETSEPCPSACGSHGACMNLQFCLCTDAGFSGHDCMQPLSCGQDCGARGSCAQGQCLCDDGWTGPACSQPQQQPRETPAGAAAPPAVPEASPAAATARVGGPAATATATAIPAAAAAGDATPVPPGGPAVAAPALGSSRGPAGCQSGCCGHGECLAGGCQCSPGWHGPACSANDTMWERIRLLQNARARREQAMKSQALAEAMSRSIAAGAPQPAGIWAQVGRLSADAQALQAAAEAAEREAIPNSDPSLLAAIELSLRCPDWPGASPPAAAAHGQAAASVRPAARGEQASPQGAAPEGGQAAGSQATPSGSQGATGGSQEGALGAQQPQVAASARAAPQTQAAPQMRRAAPQLRAPPTAQAAAPRVALQQLAMAGGGGAGAEVPPAELLAGAGAEAPPAGLEAPRPPGLGRPRGVALAQSLASLQECEDMCNYEGICREGVCYCHAGYTGEACETKKTSHRNSIPIEWAVVIVLIVGVIFYIAGLTYMSVTSKIKEETGDFYHTQA